MYTARQQRERKFNIILEWMFVHYGPNRGYPRLNLEISNFEAFKYSARIIQYNGRMTNSYIARATKHS